MTVSTGGYLKQQHNAIKALGDKAVVSDAMLSIDGYEQYSLLIKQFPWPVLSPQGEIEITAPLGAAMWQPQQVKVNFQGAISIYETLDGKIGDLLEEIASVKGGRFNAKLYEGTPDKYTRVKRVYDCFIQLDAPDRDHENRSTVLMYSGTMFGHYFGEDEKV